VFELSMTVSLFA